MYILYLATGKLEWLKQSAEADFAEGQWLLAKRYKEGLGEFLLPWVRSGAVEKWLKVSAENGYPEAMMEYASILYERKDFAAGREWTKRAAETGCHACIINYGAWIAHTPDRIGYLLDLVKGYGLVCLLKELDDGGNMQVVVDYILPRISEKMTPAQIEEGRNFAKQWKATHPPLSFPVSLVDKERNSPSSGNQPSYCFPFPSEIRSLNPQGALMTHATQIIKSYEYR